MSKTPEDLLGLFAEMETVRVQSLKTCQSDDILSLHLNTIHESMNVFVALSIEHPNDDEQQHAIRLLIARIFNNCASSLSLCLSGLYQTSGSHIRDIVETNFLLDYFHRDPTQIRKWLKADEKTLRNSFGAGAIRKHLDSYDGYVENRRGQHFTDLSRCLSHPTPIGFQLMQSREGQFQGGPYYDKILLGALLTELAKAATLAAEQVLITLRLRKNHPLASAFLPVCEEWWRKFVKPAT